MNNKKKKRIIIIQDRSYSNSKAINNFNNNKSNLKSQKDIKKEIKQMGKNPSNEKKKDINYISDIYYNKKDGFKNLGCTCYMNSFLQILIHIPGFIEKLKKDINRWKKNNIFYYLINVAEVASKENLQKIKQIFSGTYSNYKYYYQEDSQEFGAELLKILNIQYSELENSSTKWKLNGFNFKTNSTH